MDETLFPVGGMKPKAKRPEEVGTPRVQRPVRNQVEMTCGDLESLLPEEHQARMVWSYVEGADVSELYKRIQALEGSAGRPPIDPRILLAL